MEKTAEMSTPKRRYDSSRRQEEARARRRAVVEAAHRLFLEEGYGETSIERVAEEAGVSAATVYAAFGSKAGILSAVADVAVAGDFEEGLLVRERPELAWLQADIDADEWLRLGARWIRTVNERSALVLRLIESVAGADPAVAELAAKLDAGRRGDTRMAVEQGPLADVRPDLTLDEKVELLLWLGDPVTWVTQVVRGGWTPDRYEAVVLDTGRRLFLAPAP
jgi:AcrR family transcriptional regulator